MDPGGDSTVGTDDDTTFVLEVVKHYTPRAAYAPANGDEYVLYVGPDSGADFDITTAQVQTGTITAIASGVHTLTPSGANATQLLAATISGGSLTGIAAGSGNTAGIAFDDASSPVGLPSSNAVLALTAQTVPALAGTLAFQSGATAEVYTDLTLTATTTAPTSAEFTALEAAGLVKYRWVFTDNTGEKLIDDETSATYTVRAVDEGGTITAIARVVGYTGTMSKTSPTVALARDVTGTITTVATDDGKYLVLSVDGAGSLRNDARVYFKKNGTEVFITSGTAPATSEYTGFQNFTLIRSDTVLRSDAAIDVKVSPTSGGGQLLQGGTVTITLKGDAYTGAIDSIAGHFGKPALAAMGGREYTLKVSISGAGDLEFNSGTPALAYHDGSNRVPNSGTTPLDADFDADLIEVLSALTTNDKITTAGGAITEVTFTAAPSTAAKLNAALDSIAATTGKVILAEDTTIPAGSTVTIPADKTLELDAAKWLKTSSGAAVTFNVAGTLVSDTGAGAAITIENAVITAAANETVIAATTNAVVLGANGSGISLNAEGSVIAKGGGTITVGAATTGVVLTDVTITAATGGETAFARVASGAGTVTIANSAVTLDAATSEIAVGATGTLIVGSGANKVTFKGAAIADSAGSVTLASAANAAAGLVAIAANSTSVTLESGGSITAAGTGSLVVGGSGKTITFTKAAINAAGAEAALLAIDSGVATVTLGADGSNITLSDGGSIAIAGTSAIDLVNSQFAQGTYTSIGTTAIATDATGDTITTGATAGNGLVMTGGVSLLGQGTAAAVYTLTASNDGELVVFGGAATTGTITVPVGTSTGADIAGDGKASIVLGTGTISLAGVSTEAYRGSLSLAVGAKIGVFATRTGSGTVLGANPLGGGTVLFGNTNTTVTTDGTSSTTVTIGGAAPTKITGPSGNSNATIAATNTVTTT